MSTQNLTLKALDQVLDRFSKTADPDCRRLVRIIRDHYQTDDDLTGLTSIPTEPIVDQLFESQTDPGTLASRLVRFEEIREQVNKELLALAEAGHNSLGLILGDANTWIRYRRRAFKQSEVEFKVPETLHEEFQRHLSLVQRQSREEQEKLDSLLKLEETLAQSRQELEEEKAEFRTSLNQQVSQLQSTLESERTLHAEEVARLEAELKSLRENTSTLSTEHETHLQAHIEGKLKAEQDFERQASEFNENFRKLSELIQSFAREEKKHAARRREESRKLAQQEQNYRKTARRHMEMMKEYQAKQVDLDKKRRTYRSQLQKQYNDKQRELQQDFHRQVSYFQRRTDEELDERRALNEERRELTQKKQSLSQEAQSRVEEQFKKRQAELEQQAAQLQKAKQLFLELGKKLNEDKKKLTQTIRAERNARFAVTELQGILEDQESVLNDIKELAQSLETQKKEQEKREKERLKELDKDQKEVLKEIAAEREQAMEVLARFKEREQQLIKRETSELARLHEEFEDLKISLEVSQIEKDERLDKREEDIQQREDEVLSQMKEQVALYESTRSQLQAQEEEIISELEEIFSIKIELSRFESETRKFLEEAQDTFRHRLEEQNTDFESFKQQMNLLRTEALRIQENLIEKEETSEVERTSMEQTLTERIQQHEQLMESLEQALQDEVAGYRGEVKKLETTRRELSQQERDQMQTMLENLSSYEARLHKISHAFEELSEAFQQEKRLGGVQVLEDEETPPFAMEDAETFSEDKARSEWRHWLGRLAEGSVDPLESVPFFLEQWSSQWEHWLDLPDGDFWMGLKENLESAPYQQIRIASGLCVSKYPVTNLDFMKFVLSTGYRTEAETRDGGIVYYSGRIENDDGSSSISHPTLEPVADAFWWCPDGNRETLSLRHHHPVTQITWNDVAAYCTWKSEQLGQTVRLPTEAEWEYIASNFGRENRDLPWDVQEAPAHCNVEETGIGTTTAVDHFPEQDLTGGAQDVFGNVYEWVLDGPPPKGRTPGLNYRLVRGGGFLTLLQQVARWRRLAFLPDYRTSFIGFRLIRESR